MTRDDREVAAVEHPVFDHEGPFTEDAFLALGGEGRIELVDGALLVGPGNSAGSVRTVARVRAVIEAALPEGLRVIGPVPIRLGPDCVLVPDLVVTRALPDDGPAAADGESPAESGEAEKTPAEAETAPAEKGPAASTPAAKTPAASAPTAKAAAAESTEKVAEDSDAPAPEVLDAADALMVVEIIGGEHGAADRVFKPHVYARGRIPYSLLIDHDAPFAVANMIIGGRYHEYARVGGTEVLHLEEPFVMDLDVATADART
jgi:hypothetical protein